MKNHVFRYSWTTLILLSFIFNPLLATSQKKNTKIYSPENILVFADYLFKEGDYLRAAGEYQRYLFSSLISLPDTDKIYYKIGICFQEGKKYDKAIKYFNKIKETFHLSAYRETAIYQIAKSLYLKKEYKQSISFSLQAVNSVKSEIEKKHLNHLIAVNYLFRKKWDRAYDYIEQNKSGLKSLNISKKLQQFALEGKNLKRKSKLGAGLLSLIIPGAGKVYAKRTRDGIISFVTVLFTSWEAYKGFDKNGTSSIKGWIYASLAAFFYLGNIYGSMVSVGIYNRKLENEHLDNIGISINVLLH